MKLSVLMFALALSLVACNKNETATAEGHTVEHQHVTQGADHAHDDSHHGDHDHKAHHPEHTEEAAPAQ